MIRSAAAAAATEAGGRPVENMRVRARFSSQAISSDEPQTYPPQLPAALESVPICTSAGCDGQTPRPWASSVISQASCRRASSPSSADRPEVAVHAEDRLGQDQAASEPAAVGLQQLAAMADVVVVEPQHGRAGEPGPVPHAGVAEPIGEDQVVRADQGRDHPDIRQVSAAEDEGPLGAFHLREERLELGDRADGCP